MAGDDNSSNSSGPSVSDDGHPSQIGSYRILDTLGEGGMSVVYLAEQSEPVKRRVALKILKPGMDSKQIVARFESERQALAVLDHPNIAKIFDGGVAESGRPYFVMEQVKGVPITDYCDNQRLNNEERLQVFVEVCSAVQHAHLKGLIHRDLKPSNILVGVVGGKPQPKIIDFGIAKATSATLTDSTLFTRVGQIMGTPQYMSPEQAGVTGLDVDTRTDIYSLGVVLYELLVGTVPLDLRAVGDQAMQVAIREKDPPKPSTRITELGDTQDEIAKARATSVDNLRRQLSGDLDWIVMRAIEKDRTRRYETANALAMECKRFLKHEPVLARAPSPGYLLSRFMRRNRLVVVAGSVAILAIVAGAVTATLGYVRASEAELIARQEAETASRVSEFLIELFEVSDPSEARGNSITAREVLDRGAERIRTELASEPEVQAALMGTIGLVYSSLGLYDSAQPLLDNALQNSNAVFGESSVEAARNLFNLGELARLRAEYQSAEGLHRQALALRQTLLPADDLRIADSREGLGMALYYLAKYEEAETNLREAIDAYSVVGDNDGRLSQIYSNLGSILHNIDRFDEAEEYFNESLRIGRALYGDLHPEVASSLNDIALVYQDVGRFDESITAFEESLKIYRTIYAGGHVYTAETQAHLAGVIGRFGDFEKAVELYDDSIAMLHRTVGRMHMVTARVIDSAGVLHLRNAHYGRAESLLTESVEIHKALLGDRHVNTGRALNNLAALLFLSGSHVRAEPVFRESLSIRIEHLGEGNTDVANSRNNLADLLNILGKFEEAAPLAEAAAKTYSEAHSPDHWRAAVARNILGRSLSGLGRFEEAEQLLIDSIEIIAATVENSIYHRMALRRTAEMFDEWGRPHLARPYTEALACINSDDDC